MLTPVNNHLLIEPVAHETFMASQKETFEEIGVVLAVAMPEIGLNNDRINAGIPVNTAKVGDKVYFDSWLAAKYPKNDTEYYWLVKWEDIRAVEHAE